MALVTISAVSKSFGGFLAVDDLNLEIPDGSFTVLLGPSGCGKTTTLNMIAGLEEVSAGRILFDGTEVQDLAPHRRDVAVVFQSYALYPNRTVFGNIAFGLRLRGLSKPETARRVGEVAAKLGIAELLQRFPRALSGGQQQRVALARAIVRQPRVFLLDEPLSNLDAKLRSDMRIELKALQRELGGTFVYVTHDQSEAMSLADNVVVMDRGRVLQVAPPVELYGEPASVFVATFVGSPSMNIIEGEVSEGGMFTTKGWSCRIPGAASGRVLLGVRSEDLGLELLEDGEGRVRLVEHLGADSLIAVRMPFGDLIARGAARPVVAIGDRVTIQLRRCHLFDPVSAQRLKRGPQGCAAERVSPGSGVA